MAAKMITETKGSNYPTDAQLLNTYVGIEQSSIESIKRGEVTGNPILIGQTLDIRYSLCAQGYILGSPASNFLATSIRSLNFFKKKLSKQF